MKQAWTIATFIIILIISGCREDEVAKNQNEPELTSQAASTSQPSNNPKVFSSKIDNNLRDLLQEKVAQDKLPGLVLYIATSNGVWTSAAGVANQNPAVPMKPTDRFRVGNLTNMFTAVMCLQLVEEGQLDLDQPISSYLPQDVSDRLANSNKIDVRQLLAHRSGLADAQTDAFQQAVRDNPTREWTAKEVLEYAYDLEPVDVRGSFAYSNTNYLLLQLIIESITGQPFAEAIQQRIRTPAGLSNTFTELRDSIPGGFAQGYQDWNQDGTLDNVTQPLINDGLGLGDKGIISNAPDLVRFFQVLFLGDKLLYPASLDEMLETISIGMGDAYGLGMTHMETRWGEAWGHQGKALGFQSAMLYLPAHDLMLVAWTNDGDREAARPMTIAQDALHTILGEPNFKW